jgi:hypothetical protein
MSQQQFRQRDRQGLQDLVVPERPRLLMSPVDQQDLVVQQDQQDLAVLEGLVRPQDQQDQSLPLSLADQLDRVHQVIHLFHLIH